jgi:hypothetical protein
MAAIVLVHGIAQQFLGARVLHGSLAGALADGVAHAGGPTVSEEDVAVAFYGNLFRRPGTKGPSWPDAEESADPWEADLLMRWWSGAAAAEPDLVEPPDRAGAVKTRTPRTVQRALSAMSRSRWLAAAGERLLVGTAAQARAYLHDEQIRSAAQRAVMDLITPRTRVVIGHSLGSVVAYEALCARPQPRDLAFVTLGSPLGIRNLFFDRLRPPPAGGAGQIPAQLTAWTNICDAYDIVALVKDLGPLFPGVTDVRVHNGWQAHDLGRHLTSAEVGAAVAAGLAATR